MKKYQTFIRLENLSLMITYKMSERIFITGGTGFIGRNLIEALIHKNRKITCLIRKNEKANFFGKKKNLN